MPIGSIVSIVVGCLHSMYIYMMFILETIDYGYPVLIVLLLFAWDLKCVCVFMCEIEIDYRFS